MEKAVSKKDADGMKAEEIHNCRPNSSIRRLNKKATTEPEEKGPLMLSWQVVYLNSNNFRREMLCV